MSAAVSTPARRHPHSTWAPIGAALAFYCAFSIATIVSAFTLLLGATTVFNARSKRPWSRGARDAKR